MLMPEYTTRFKKDLKVLQKRKYGMEPLKEIIALLCEETPLPEKNMTTIYREIGPTIESAILPRIGC